MISQQPNVFRLLALAQKTATDLPFRLHSKCVSSVQYPCFTLQHLGVDAELMMRNREEEICQEF